MFDITLSDVGEIIRNAVVDRREKAYLKARQQLYFFRIDEKYEHAIFVWGCFHLCSPLHLVQSVVGVGRQSTLQKKATHAGSSITPVRYLMESYVK